jgi:hypothetical protein
MNFRARLAKAERFAADNGTGHCHACPPPRILRYRQASPDSEPILLPGQEHPGACPRCGRAADVTEIVEVVIRSRAEAERFRNAQRLADASPPLAAPHTI